MRTETLAVKRLTGYCPDVGGTVPRATPWEHLQLAARLRRLEPGWEDRARELLERFDLGAAAHRVTAGFSHGMGRRMSVILAAFHEPEVLLLDEPFDGVDPLGVEATMDVVADARCPRRRRPRLHPPARARGRGLRRTQSCCAGALPSLPLPAPEMTGERQARVSTALSSTDRLAATRWAEPAASPTCVPLLAFRAAGPFAARPGRLRRCRHRRDRSRSPCLPPWLPAYLPDGDGGAPTCVLLPTGLFGVLLIALVSAARPGGGRELVPREQGVAFPVSPTTDHLGALLMAPLNIAWLLQSWTLLGVRRVRRRCRPRDWCRRAC